MQIGSITSYSVYSNAYLRSAILKNVKDEMSDEGAEVIAKQLDDATDKIVNQTEKQGNAPVQNLSSLPWASLMHQLNLTPTGDYTEDYNATIARLDELIKYTRNPDKLQDYLSLADQVSQVFVTPQTSGAINNSSSGSEQIAQLNRVMMLNMSLK